MRNQIYVMAKADCVITTKGFIKMNNYLKLMPCLKDVKGAPLSLEGADVPLKGIELCALILGTLPYTLVMAYWAKKELNHFPTDPTKLAKELGALEPHVKQTQKLIAQVKSNQGWVWKKRSANPP